MKLQEATAEEVARWKDAVVFFYKKVLFKKRDKVRDRERDKR